MISIHGHDPETHDSQTGVPGSFAETMQGISNISSLKQEFGARLEIKTTVTKANLRHLKDIVKLMLNFNVDSIGFNVIKPYGRAEKNFDSVVPKLSDVAGEYLKLEEHFGTEISMGINGLPRCILNLKSVGFDEEFIKSNGTEHVVLGNGSLKSAETAYRAVANACQRCSVRGSCDGIFRIYLDKYGDAEFKPI
jgi:MoaA/NifB/PqqE/SkfB family radical SAM enzyme